MLNGGGADHLEPGTALPSLTLPATDGSQVDLAALQGPSAVIVYPWTGRPGEANPPDWDVIPGAHGSTPELEGFRDRHTEFMRRGVRLFGLSRPSILSPTPRVTRPRWCYGFNDRWSTRRSKALVLGVLDRVAEPVEPFLEIVGQERHAEKIVFGAVDALGAGG